MLQKMRNIMLALILSTTWASTHAADPIFDYAFNAGSGVLAHPSRGSAEPLWLLAARTKGGDPSSMWTSGVSGQPGDFAIRNTMADEGMGVGLGGWLFGQALPAATDLKSFTLTGWMRYQPGPWGSHATILICAHGKAGFGLDLLPRNRIRLMVNGQFATTAPGAYDPAAKGWTFFAITYDATRPNHQATFLLGTAEQPVRQVETQSLSAGPVAGHKRQLVVGASVGGLRPFAGTLDALQMVGSRDDAAGALSIEAIEAIRQRGLQTPQADQDTPAPVVSPVKARLVEVNKIWHQMPHNGFPDLVRYNDTWLCAFREATEHKTTVGGAVRIIASKDGRRWDTVARFAYEGEDVREVHFARTPQGHLVAVGATADMTTANPPTHRSYAWMTQDGVNWSQRHLVPADIDIWLWRATLHPNQEMLYGGAYYCDPPRGLDLYRSADGVTWERFAPNIMSKDFPSESDITFLPDGRAVMLLRQGRGGSIGIAQPPYNQWTWTDLKRRIAAPHLLQLPDGRLIASVRLWEGGTRVALCWVDPDNAQLVEFLTLPSKPDTGYAGLQWHDGHLWAAYYSDPGGQTSIYFAKIAIE